MAETASIIMEEGGIDACVCAMRANVNKLEIIKSASKVMLKLSHLPGGSVAVARQGGTRQIINTIQVRACLSRGVGGGQMLTLTGAYSREYGQSDVTQVRG